MTLAAYTSREPGSCRRFDDFPPDAIVTCTSGTTAIILGTTTSRRRLSEIAQTPNRCSSCVPLCGTHHARAQQQRGYGIHFLCLFALKGFHAQGNPFATCMFARSCRRTCSRRISHLPQTSCAERLTLHTLHCIFGSLCSTK